MAGTFIQRQRPACKIHGGKYYLAPWVAEHLPAGHESLVYVEPFCGMGSVFLSKPRGRAEALADLDQGVVGILRALRDRPDEFVNRLRQVEYTEAAFLHAKDRVVVETDDLGRAVHEYCVRRMSRGGLKQRFAWSARSRGGRPGDENAWYTMLDQLPIIAERAGGSRFTTSTPSR